MKQFRLTLVIGFAFFLCNLPSSAFAQDVAAASFEYIDLRWDGTDRMCIVYPDGHVDFVGKELEKLDRPDDANKRAFYMTVALNNMAAKGYEFVGIISDEIIMRRRIQH